LADVQKNTDGLRTIYDYLMNYDLSNWESRDLPMTSYHEVVAEINKPPLIQFMEWWVGKSQAEGLVEMEYFTKDVFKQFEIFIEQSYIKNYNLKHPGDLLLKMTHLSLPNNCFEEGKRCREGKRRKCNFPNLCDHFQIQKVDTTGFLNDDNEFTY
jgi:hypothetical protein